MTDFPLTGGVDTPVTLGGLAVASFFATGGVVTPAVLGGRPISSRDGIATPVALGVDIIVVGTTPPALSVPVVMGMNYAETAPGALLVPVTMGYTLLGIVSVAYSMTGGIVTEVIVGDSPMNKRVSAVMVVGGIAGRIAAHVTDGIVTAVEMGGTAAERFRVVGGIDVPIEMDGTTYDGQLRALITPTEMGGALTAVLSSETGGIDTPIVLGSNVQFTAGIETLVGLGGAPSGGNRVLGGITVPMVLVGSFQLTVGVYGALIVPLRLGGAGVTSQSPVASEDAEIAALGYRRLLPVVAYATGVRTTADISAVPFGQAFLVAPDFADTAGVFYESGAGANYVGYRMGTASRTFYVFRPPRGNEVIWQASDNTLLRYERDRSSNRSAWKSYQSWPQRALNEVQAFQAFDPDRVYDYYATVMGAMMSQLQHDNSTLLTMLDASRCPRDYLAALATTFDAEFDADTPDSNQRLSVVSAVPSARRRGFPDASVLRMRAAGYRSSIFEVWTKIGWPTFSTTQTDVQVTTSAPASIISLGYAGVNAPPAGLTYFRNNFIPDSQEWVEVTHGVLVKRFYFDNIPSGAPPGSVMVPVGTSVSQTTRSNETMAALVAAIVAWQAGLVVLGMPGPDYLMLPHSYDVAEPLGYWASRFVIVILNKADGARVSLDEVEKQALRGLLERALPVAARVKSFGTAVPAQDEAVHCSETFTVTRIV